MAIRWILRRLGKEGRVLQRHGVESRWSERAWWSFSKGTCSGHGMPVWHDFHETRPDRCRARTFSSLSLEARRRRCVYRAGTSGWRELDVILSSWAARNVQRLDASGVQALEQLLDTETPLLYRYLTLQEAPPADLCGNAVMQDIVRFVQNGHPQQRR